MPNKIAYVFAAIALLQCGSSVRLARAQAQVDHLSLSSLTSQAVGTQTLGPAQSAESVDLTLALPLRNTAELDDLLVHLYTPGDPACGHYLSSSEFAERFGPSDSDVTAVRAFAQSQGLQVRSVSSNGTLIHVSGAAADVERTFGVRMERLARPDGSTFLKADREPSLPTAIASRLVGIAGLDGSFRPQSQARRTNGVSTFLSNAASAPQFSSSGPGGLSPNDIRSLYSLSATPNNGAGQTLALVEFDTYLSSDIAKYKSQYGGTAPVTNIGVDGFNTATAPAGSQSEDVLDIDMMLALAPAAKAILVYEDTSNGNGLLDTYNQIAVDDTAQVVSTSWTNSEDQFPPSLRQAEFNIFAQMAAQGQSMFCSAGDAGAWDDQQTPGSGAHLSVADPASQPLVTAVGATTLSDTGSEQYAGETAWFSPSDTSRGPLGTGGGGGISGAWGIPAYQVGAFSTATNTQGSTTQRNVPDVSLFGNWNVGGYSIYFTDPTDGANWYGYNGTSATSPLWAAFAALVNQARAAKSLPPIGFLNPALYGLAANSQAYARDFNDVTGGSTNGFYETVPGYDNATGFGSFRGNALIADLAAAPSAPAVAGVSVSPSTDYLTNPVTVKVGLANPAGPGGALVVLTLNGAFWQTLSVPPGATSASAGFPVSATGTYTVAAIFGGKSVTTLLTVIPVTIKSITATPSPAVFGGSVTATVTLTAPSPNGGSKIPITWNGAAWGTVSIGTGGTTASTTLKAPAAGNATLSGTLAGGTANAALTVTQPAVSSLTLTPSSLALNQTYTVTVTLNVATPITASVPITKSGVALTSVSIPAGQTSATTAALKPTLPGAFSIGATYGGATRTATLTVLPPTITAFTVSPSPVILTDPVTATVTLSVPAPTGGESVPITFAGTAWGKVVVPAGSASASLSLKPLSTGTISVVATLSGSTSTASLTVNPVALSNLTTSTTSTALNKKPTLTITLDAPAPTGGSVVTLTNNGAAWTTLKIGAGATTGTISFPPTAAGTFTIGASLGGVSKTVTITVIPPTITALTVSPNPVIVSKPVKVTATISVPAPTGGVSIPLTFGTTSWGTIAIAAGATSASVSLTPLSTGAISVVATLAGVQTTATLTVNPVAISTFTVSPTAITLGTADKASVTLNAPAPSGGSTIDLICAGKTLATVVVAAGATSGTATFTPTAAGSLSISAALGGVTKTATLTVH